LYHCRLVDGHAKGQTRQLFRCTGLRAHRRRGRSWISIPVPVSLPTIGPLPTYSRSLSATGQPCDSAERQPVPAAAVPVRTTIHRGRGTTATIQLRTLLPRRATVRHSAAAVLSRRTATALRTTADRRGRVPLTIVSAATG